MKATVVEVTGVGGRGKDASSERVVLALEPGGKIASGNLRLTLKEGGGVKVGDEWEVTLTPAAKKVKK